QYQDEGRYDEAVSVIATGLWDYLVELAAVDPSALPDSGSTAFDRLAYGLEMAKTPRARQHLKERADLSAEVLILAGEIACDLRRVDVARAAFELAFEIRP